MKTLITDDQKRIRLPDAEPRQAYAYEFDGYAVKLTRVETVNPPKPKLIRRGGRTLLIAGRKITNEDVKRALEDFPN